MNQYGNPELREGEAGKSAGQEMLAAMQAPEVDPAEQAKSAQRQARIEQYVQKRGGIIPEGGQFVANAATGDQLELDLGKFTPQTIAEAIRGGLENASEHKRAEIAEKLKADIQSGNTSVLEENYGEDEAFEAKELILQLAQDIVDALNETPEALAVVNPADVTNRTESKLGRAGDACFLVHPDKASMLKLSLQQQHVEFEMMQDNEYGFVLRNKDLDFRVMFIYSQPENRVLDYYPSAGAAVQGTAGGERTIPVQAANDTSVATEHTADSTSVEPANTQAHNPNQRVQFPSPQSAYPRTESQPQPRPLDDIRPAA